jgi:Acyl-CoA carboxylase epsilon subunit
MRTIPPVVVRGTATPEELAAIIATLGSRREPEIADSGYEMWRRRRLVAVREAIAIP